METVGALELLLAIFEFFAYAVLVVGVYAFIGGFLGHIVGKSDRFDATDAVLVMILWPFAYPALLGSALGKVVVRWLKHQSG